MPPIMTPDSRTDSVLNSVVEEIVLSSDDGSDKEEYTDDEEDVASTNISTQPAMVDSGNKSRVTIRKRARRRTEVGVNAAVTPMVADTDSDGRISSDEGESCDDRSSNTNSTSSSRPSSSSGKEEKCMFCFRAATDDGSTLGKLCRSYTLLKARGAQHKRRRMKQTIVVHELCLMLASGLPANNGDRENSLMGFAGADVRKEALRASKLKCSYCQERGATVGCVIGQCKVKFHLPCGKENGSFHLYFNDFRSYCRSHLPDCNSLMTTANGETPTSNSTMRKRRDSASQLQKALNVEWPTANDGRLRNRSPFCARTSCGLCLIGRISMRAITGEVIRTSCCQMDSSSSTDVAEDQVYCRYYHHECVQSFALTSGYYHLKCPSSVASATADDRKKKDAHSKRFYKQIQLQGVYVPKRDAVWEMDLTAEEEERRRSQGAAGGAPLRLRCCLGETDSCLCPLGADHHERSPRHDVNLHWEFLDVCPTCAGTYIHRACAGLPWAAHFGETRSADVSEMPWQCSICSIVPSTRSSFLDNALPLA